MIFDVLWSWGHVLFISEVFLCSLPTTWYSRPWIRWKILKRHSKSQPKPWPKHWVFMSNIIALSWVYGRQYHVVGGEHKNTSEMKSTWPQLHKTSNIIEKFHLSMKLCWFGKSSIFCNRNLWFLCWPKIWQWYMNIYIFENVDLWRIFGDVDYISI